MFIPSMDRTIDDINHPDLVPFLKDLQGNILKSHGRNHVAVLLLNFGPSDPTAQPMKARAWIRDISSAASNRLTSAHEQNQQKSTVRNGTDTFQTLALSSRGYEFLSTKRPSDGAFLGRC